MPRNWSRNHALERAEAWPWGLRTARSQTANEDAEGRRSQPEINNTHKESRN